MYLGYIAIDRLGLKTESRTAVVVDKQHFAARDAPYVSIAAGRPWVQSQYIPEVYILILRAQQLELSAGVSPPVYEQVQIGDMVRIKMHRHRLSSTSHVSDVTL
jgi:hypothetical protein